MYSNIIVLARYRENLDPRDPDYLPPVSVYACRKCGDEHVTRADLHGDACEECGERLEYERPATAADYGPPDEEETEK